MNHRAMRFSFVLVSPQSRRSTSTASRRSSSAVTARGTRSTLNLNNTLPSRRSMRSTSNACLACQRRRKRREKIALRRQSTLPRRALVDARARSVKYVNAPVSSPTTPPLAPPPAPPSDFASLALFSSVSRSHHPLCSSRVSFHSPPVAWRRARVSRSRSSVPPPLSPRLSTPRPHRTDPSSVHKNSHRRTIARVHPSARETTSRRRRRRGYRHLSRRSSPRRMTTGVFPARRCDRRRVEVGGRRASRAFSSRARASRSEASSCDATCARAHE